MYHRPNSRFTAEFLGETNFISGTVGSLNGNQREILTPIGKLHSDQDVSISEGKEVTLSIRPEAIHILREGEKSPKGHSTVTTTWNSRCFLGETAQHELAAADGTALKSLELRHRDAFAPGSSISVSIAPEDIVILDT
jgi:ABC-type Fe3+/spermidine/putrescine transport system ATPase subunit